MEDFNSKTQEIINKLVNIIYEDYGSQEFEYMEFIYKKMCERMVYFKPSSGLYNNHPIYIINLYIEPNVLMLKKKTVFKKCVHCKKRKCDMRMMDSGEFCHYGCNLDKMRSCMAENKEELIEETCENNITLRHKCPLDEDDNCMVCFDKCQTITKCGHRICRSCVNSIHCVHKDETKCPMCRRNLVEKEDENNKQDNIYIVEVNIKDTRFVRVRLIFE